MITNENIQKLKANINIVDFLSNYLTIHKSGSNFSCVCPFHSDKNPSMIIYENEGYYHCFGCGEHGDVIKFLQKYKNLSFIDAVKELANIYNFPLENTKKPILKNDVLVLLNEFYVSQLSLRNDLINYLEKRKITRDLRVKFSIGYAPFANQTLNLLKKAEISMQTALNQGALKQNENGVYPSFIDRITFPIFDAFGLIIGFGARTLNPNNPAKYVNSPASKLFDKKSIFYGFHLAKNDILKHKKIIICEGYMDAICLHKAGFTYAVAVLGTALTINHLRLIKKDCFVSLCFDKDNAGQNAAFKAGVILSQNGYNAGVITLKSHKDPGEYIEFNDEEKLLNEMNENVNIVYFCIEYIFKNELKLDFLDKITLRKIDPFLIKSAYSKVLEYTNKIDSFIASAHLKIFCEKYELDFMLLKNTSTKPKSTKTPKISNLEDGILYFLINSQASFNVLIIKEFFSSDLIEPIINKDFNDPKIINLLDKIHPTNKINNILVFFNNIAKFYASKNVKNSILFQNYASVLEKNPKIVHSKEKLSEAYFLLTNLISIFNNDLSFEQISKLKNEISQLGA